MLMLLTLKIFKRDKVNGVDTTLIFFIFPLGVPSVETALSRAIEQDKCVVGLTDVTVTYGKIWLFSVGLNNISVDGRQLLIQPCQVAQIAVCKL